MKIHDWTRVTAGTFHDFHSAWITHIKEALNANLLPPGFYAMAEQHAGRLVPDILTLTSPEWSNPEGIHALLWDDPFKLPADRRLTLVSYRIDRLNEAFIEPIAVGQQMPDMPIFLDPAWYVTVPLASTYDSAWRGIPKPFQSVLEASWGIMQR